MTNPSTPAETAMDQLETVLNLKQSDTIANGLEGWKANFGGASISGDWFAPSFKNGLIIDQKNPDQFKTISTCLAALATVRSPVSALTAEPQSYKPIDEFLIAFFNLYSAKLLELTTEQGRETFAEVMLPMAYENKAMAKELSKDTTVSKQFCTKAHPG